MSVLKSFNRFHKFGEIIAILLYHGKIVRISSPKHVDFYYANLFLSL